MNCASSRLAQTRPPLPQLPAQTRHDAVLLQLERSERLRLQMAYDQLREQTSKEVKALKQEVG